MKQVIRTLNPRLPEAPMMRRTLMMLGLVYVVAAPPARAADAAAPALERAEVGKYVQPLIDGEWCQSVVVGLIGPKGESVYGYGRTSRGKDGREPDGKTVYEIGSVTKAFTGVLLADMV